MATQTFLQLQQALASMYGYESPADLPTQDLVDIKAFINSAHFECYAPTNGARAMWPEQYTSGIFKAPVPASLTLVNGSTAVTGFVFEAAYVGSFVKIGDRFYRYGSTTTLVQPWDGDPGVYAATVYYNAFVLPWQIVQLAGSPNLIGIGILGPIPDPDTELQLRSAPAYDFDSKSGGAPFTISRNLFRADSFFSIGDPRYYHIDQASVGTQFSIGNRIHVFPIPDRVMTFELRACIVPPGLVADGDIPVMPAQTVDNILLPIAREILALNSTNRRYTGPNAAQLTILADRARAQLVGMRRIQRDVAGTVRLKAGW